jgi:hypothetical protein
MTFQIIPSTDWSLHGNWIHLIHKNHIWRKDFRKIKRHKWLQEKSTKIQKTTYICNEIFNIKANKVEKIPTPEAAYVYPNFDPLSEVNK